MLDITDPDKVTCDIINQNLIKMSKIYKPKTENEEHKLKISNIIFSHKILKRYYFCHREEINDDLFYKNLSNDNEMSRPVNVEDDDSDEDANKGDEIDTSTSKYNILYCHGCADNTISSLNDIKKWNKHSHSFVFFYNTTKQKNLFAKTIESVYKNLDRKHSAETAYNFIIANTANATMKTRNYEGTFYSPIFMVSSNGKEEDNFLNATYAKLYEGPFRYHKFMEKAVTHWDKWTEMIKKHSKTQDDCNKSNTFCTPIIITSRKNTRTESDLDIFFIDMNEDIFKELIPQLNPEELSIISSRSTVAMFGEDSGESDDSRKISWKYSMFGKRIAEATGLMRHLPQLNSTELIITFTVVLGLTGAWIISLFA